MTPVVVHFYLIQLSLFYLFYQVDLFNQIKLLPNIRESILHATAVNKATLLVLKG
jgi:hypothetical protein